MYALTEPSIDAVTQLDDDGYALLRGALAPRRSPTSAWPSTTCGRRHRDDASASARRALHLLAFLDEDRGSSTCWTTRRALDVDRRGPRAEHLHVPRHLDVHPPEHEPVTTLDVAPGRRDPEPRSRNDPATADVAEGRVLPHRRARVPTAGTSSCCPGRTCRNAIERPSGRRRCRAPSRSSPRPATRSCSTAACGTCGARTDPIGSARRCSSPTPTGGSARATTCLDPAPIVERLTPAQRQLVGLDDATTFDRCGCPTTGPLPCATHASDAGR